MNRAYEVVRAFVHGRDPRASGVSQRGDDERLAFEALAILAERHERRTTRVTPVATTPRTALRARRSASVLRELIRGATLEIVVLGYDVSDVDIINELAERASMGVAVDLLVDAAQTPIDRLVDAWPVGAGEARVWSTGLDERGRPYRLHAKAIIVDGHRCMLGSANLTYSGLHTNLELGVLLDGPVARRVRSHVSQMRQSGMVVPARTLGADPPPEAEAAPR